MKQTGCNLCEASTLANFAEMMRFSCCCRYLLGVTDEERQERREQVLGTTLADFKAFADVLEAARGSAAQVVAVTNADRAAAVLEQKPGFWDVKKVL
jgi:Zn-dependent M16 (insulinase) family peptidase